MSKDFKNFDKNGNPLNLMPKFNHSRRGDYYTKWLENPEKFEPSLEDIKCELQLSALGVYEQLNFLLHIGEFKEEIEPWNDKWVPYLRREGVLNDREGLLLMGLEGDTPCDSLSMPEARKRTGRKLQESDFNVPTALYHDLKSLHPLLDYFQPLGRTMLIKSNTGGFFPPHKDSPIINRDCFRIVVFIGRSVEHDSYQWEIDGKVMPIIQNRAYYIDTRKTHRTNSWADDSIHCIINVPKTWENIMKLMTMCKYT